MNGFFFMIFKYLVLPSVPCHPSPSNHDEWMPSNVFNIDDKKNPGSHGPAFSWDFPSKISWHPSVLMATVELSP
jgi:hypothetical protein